MKEKKKYVPASKVPSHIRSSSTGLMLVVILVMTTKVLPVFSQIYTELGSELTGTVALLMKISNMINHYMAYIILIIILLVVLCIIFFNTNSGKNIFLDKNTHVNSLKPLCQLHVSRPVKRT